MLDHMAGGQQRATGQYRTAVLRPENATAILPSGGSAGAATSGDDVEDASEHDTTVLDRRGTQETPPRRPGGRSAPGPRRTGAVTAALSPRRAAARGQVGQAAEARVDRPRGRGRPRARRRGHRRVVRPRPRRQRPDPRRRRQDRPAGAPEPRVDRPACRGRDDQPSRPVRRGRPGHRDPAAHGPRGPEGHGGPHRRLERPPA
ncbi:hypothetical protein DEJ15_08900 [Curtobacterium sp. MCJR17_043]|nr:hypothetical protein [Curtobacterium sp. MCJR17_043]WIB37193.1 hypothetical protein DEJ15_08900 [Curtobacterium sp. MCJR17_043]